LPTARTRLAVEDINTVFIDLLSFGIEHASKFVFEIRKKMPWIVFVLFQDQERVEERREEFFHGERSRFSHYYRLDKRTPVDSFDVELAASIRVCQGDLSWRMSRKQLRRLENEATPVGPSAASRTTVAVTDSAQLHVGERSFAQKDMVFVSHRFAEADERLAQGLMRHLADKGFKVITGKLATGYISRAVIQRIKDAEFFLCLLTRGDRKEDGTYTASAWLHQELGAALAFGKPVVLMVEGGVTDLGGLQGDVQRIPFEDRGFMNAALDAVEVLRAYAGREAT
jgi:hypothetical protein